MTKAKELLRLRQLSKLITDQKLAVLQSCATARAASLERLRDLDTTSTEQHESAVIQAGVNLRYERWADARRSEINITLARQTAEWLEAREAASKAFGRTEVLRKLQEKM